jgi:hypothetical protein
VIVAPIRQGRSFGSTGMSKNITNTTRIKERFGSILMSPSQLRRAVYLAGYQHSARR